MRKKRGLTISLLIILLLSSSCTMKKDAAVPSLSGDPGTSSNALPDKKRPELTFRVKTDAWPDGMKWDTQNDPFAKLIRDRFQVIIEPELSEGTDMLTLLAVANQMPHFFTYYDYYSHYEINTDMFVNKGDVRKIPYSLIQKHSRLNEMVKLYDGEDFSALKRISGTDGIYFLPKPDAYREGDMVPTYTQSMRGIFYRADWADELNIRKPETVEDFYTMLVRFMQKYPGEQDYTSTSIHYLTDAKDIIYNAFIPEYGKSPWYFDTKASRWNLTALHPNGLTLAQWVNKFDQPQLLSTLASYPGLFSSTTMDEKSAYFFSGDIKALNDFYESIANKMDWSIEEADTNIGVITALKADAQSPIMHYTAAPVYGEPGMMVSSAVSDEELDRFLEVYDWLLSDEAKRMGAFGWEDEHWTWNSDKTALTLEKNPATGMPYDIQNEVSQASSITAFSSWNNDIILDMRYPSALSDPVRRRANSLLEQWKSHHATDLSYIREVSLSDVGDSMTQIFDESPFIYRANAIHQNMDSTVEQAYQIWKQSKETLYAPYIEAFNVRVNELGISPYNTAK